MKTPQHVIYQPRSAHCQAFAYKMADGVFRVLHTAPRPLDPAHATLNADRTADDYIRECNEKRKAGTPEYQVMSWEEAYELIKEAEERDYIAPWKEIDEDRWNTMLNLLPPCGWRTVRGVELFYVSEALTSDIHQFLARLGDRYFSCNRRRGTNYEELAEAVAQAAEGTQQ